MWRSDFFLLPINSLLWCDVMIKWSWHFTNVFTYLITHVGCIAAGMGIVFSYVSVCLFVHTLKVKWFKLSTPIFVHVYSIAVAPHALTQRSKGHSRTVTKTVSCTVARDEGCYSRVLLLPAWVCMLIQLPMFSSWCCIFRSWIWTSTQNRLCSFFTASWRLSCLVSA